MASKKAVKTCMVLPLAKVTVCVVLLLSVAYAQTSQDPPSSSVVSSNAGTVGSETIQPGTPAITEDSAITVDPASLLPDLPPVPQKNATLIGGTLARLDRVRDEMTVHLFGGGQMRALFDPRTRVFRGRKEASIADLRQGERVYLDTILDGTTIFARTIRLSSVPSAGESQGIVLKYKNGELTFRDSLDPSPVRIRFDSSTKFFQDHQSVPSSRLVPGSLIAVTFDAEGNGHDLAREITILALPGTRYTFVGQILHIDLRTGLLVLKSSVDQKTYEIYLDAVSPDDNLQPGTNVTLMENFENSRYVARMITIEPQGK